MDQGTDEIQANSKQKKESPIERETHYENGETRVMILISRNGCKNSGKIWWILKFHYREALTPVLLMKFL